MLVDADDTLRYAATFFLPPIKIRRAATPATTRRRRYFAAASEEASDDKTAFDAAAPGYYDSAR